MAEATELQRDPEDLVARYLEDPRPDLKDLIMVEYAPLVERVARKFCGLEPFEDLVQVGFIGLLNALTKYDPDAGVRFNTYATYLVAGEIKHYLRKSAQSVDHSSSDIRQGFVYKRVPHVTLKSIANNPDIKEGMTRAAIDAAIARHADTETLFDQPYEDKKTVRVSGPFTVESLSPHRTISVEEKKQRAEVGKNGWKMKVI